MNRCGEDGRGKNGMLGFFIKMCRERPDLMVAAALRIIPTQRTVERKRKVYHSFEDLTKHLEELGLHFDLKQLKNYKGPIINHFEVEQVEIPPALLSLVEGTDKMHAAKARAEW